MKTACAAAAGKEGEKVWKKTQARVREMDWKRERESQREEKKWSRRITKDPQRLAFSASSKEEERGGEKQEERVKGRVGKKGRKFGG